MIQLFTAVGSYKIRKNEGGSQYPVVILKNQEYLLNIPEMVLWSSLVWQISTYDEMQGYFERKITEAGFLQQLDMDRTLDSLLSKGLVVSSGDNAGVDALYNLVSKLYIVPVSDNPITKISAFLHLTIIQKVPFKITKGIFVIDELTYDEKLVMKLVRQTLLSTAELIKCIHRSCFNLKANEKVLDACYDDEWTTCDNIHIPAMNYKEQKPVLQAVSNLYLKKRITFITL